MDQNYIEHHSTGGVSFVGPDAVSFFAATSLYHAMRLYVKTGIKMSRIHTPKNMLAKASEYTGKTYKRGQMEQAANDVEVWAQTMRAALPES